MFPHHRSDAVRYGCYWSIRSVNRLIFSGQEARTFRQLQTQNIRHITTLNLHYITLLYITWPLPQRGFSGPIYKQVIYGWDQTSAYIQAPLPAAISPLAISPSILMNEMRPGHNLYSPFPYPWPPLRYQFKEHVSMATLPQETKVLFVVMLSPGTKVNKSSNSQSLTVNF